MSQDPQRLLSATSDADELERELLASVRQVDPPRGAHAEVWGGIATQIAAATLASAALGAATSGSASAATSATGAVAVEAGKAGVFGLSKALATKLLLGLAVGGAAAGAGSAWVSSREAPRGTLQEAAGASRVAASVAVSAVSRSASAAKTTDLQSAAVSKTDTPLALEATEPLGAHSSSRSSRERAEPDRLGVESQLLARARAELRSGNTAAAQATLQRLQARFPKGVLRQEVEVLAIEILAAHGKASASQERARAFIKAHPESPHSTNLRRSLEQP